MSPAEGITTALDVAGATVLVTGASAGIGKALALQLAQRGAIVGLVGRRADRLAEVLAACQVHTPASRSWACDLGDVDAAVALCIEAWDTFGHLDVVVHNAAIPMRRKLTELSVDDWDTTLATDLTSPVRMTMALLPRMLERRRGQFVFVSSFGGRAGIAHETAYCAAKFGMCGFAEAMALDLWHEPVGVRLIVPGAIDTEIWDRPGNDAPLYEGEKEPPESVAAGIIDAIEGERFEHYLPDMKAIAEFKTADVDAFLAGAATLLPPVDG